MAAGAVIVAKFRKFHNLVENPKQPKLLAIGILFGGAVASETVFPIVAFIYYLSLPETVFSILSVRLFNLELISVFRICLCIGELIMHFKSPFQAN